MATAATRPRIHRVTRAALAPLLSAIAAATAWLEEAGVPAAVVGGVAASIHGQPRVTKDVDWVALADLDDCERLVALASKFEIARVTRTRVRCC